MSRDLADESALLADAAHRNLWAIVAETASVLNEGSPVARRMWLADVVADMYVEQDGACALCGEFMERDSLEVDHLVPFCYGGGNERANIQLAHGPCNRRKRASVDVFDLLHYLEDRWMNR